MENNKKAFTFVELIIVLVIISILATVGFTVYEGYLGTGRDTNKVVQLKGIHQSLGVYTTKSKLPIPESKIDIEASGDLFLYQGDLNDTIAKNIGFQGSVFDDEFQIYPTYSLAKNRKDFQVLTYLEDGSTLQALVPQARAFTDYQSLYTTSMGKPLGILFDVDSQAPIHTIESYSASGSYDIISGTGSITVHLSDSRVFDSDNSSITDILPNQSCKRILEVGKSKGDGEYVISPTGSGNIKTYCDMRTDGGGWTFVAYIDARNASPDIFSTEVGIFRPDRTDSNASDQNTSYSIDATHFKHTEMMISINSPKVSASNDVDQLIFFEYPRGNSFFYSGPTPCVSGNLPKFRLGLTGEYEQASTWSCNSTTWVMRRGSPSEQIMGYQTPRGAQMHPAMIGSFSQINPSWIYVR